MKKKLKYLTSKFWFNTFIKISAVFVVFVAALCICNTVFLEKYYEATKKKELISVAKSIAQTDIDDSEAMVDVIGNIQSENGFEAEIYDSSGKTLYSSSSGQMMDFFFSDKNNKLHMNHRPLTTIESNEYSDGSVMEKAKELMSGKEFFVYSIKLDNDYTCEVRIQVSSIQSSAKSANKFISLIAVIMLFLSLIWVFWFSRRISKPISEMNKITKNMAGLDFNEKLKPKSKDEIGQLAVSINNLSGKLDETLMDLKKSNAQLRDEIELEHQLDVMRRGFVANVSHELKTPIAIIQGYAEGLKAGINSDSKDKYCNIIMDESKRMNKLVLSILNLSKYESGQMPTNLAEFNISEAANSIAKRITDSKNINLLLDTGDNLTAFADCDMIEQVMKSYLENAVSHVDENGTVEVSVKQTTPYLLTVSVINTGSHVDEEMMPQIWQSFFRGDKSHKRDSSRFGLGLSIVSAIIKLHKRECGVYNTENGVCFWFTVSAGASTTDKEQLPDNQQ